MIGKKIYYIVLIIAPIICFLSAFILAFNRIEGWGWFLFIGLCAIPSISFKSSNDYDDDDDGEDIEVKTNIKL